MTEDLFYVSSSSSSFCKRGVLSFLSLCLLPSAEVPMGSPQKQDLYPQFSELSPFPSLSDICVSACSKALCAHPCSWGPSPFLSTRKIFARQSQGLFKELNFCVSLVLEKGQGNLTRQVPVYPKLCPFCATPAQSTATWRSKFPSPLKKSFRVSGIMATLQHPWALSGKQLEAFLLEKPTGKPRRNPK